MRVLCAVCRLAPRGSPALIDTEGQEALVAEDGRKGGRPAVAPTESLLYACDFPCMHATCSLADSVICTSPFIVFHEKDTGPLGEYS